MTTLKQRADKRRKDLARHRLANWGLTLCRAVPRDEGGWQIEAGGKVVAGAYFQLTIDDVEAYIVRNGIEKPREQIRQPKPTPASRRVALKSIRHVHWLTQD